MVWSTAREISAGDTVIVWLTRDQLLPLVVTPGKDLNIKFGYYRHADFVGVPYGTKLGSRNGKGFIHLLRPTPELWTMALPHRTQILYMADIAFITSWLNIRTGSTVVEAGTGSGSFSHSLARTIGPSGHLYTYEFHETRAQKAQEDFVRHGMNNVTLAHRNVCKDGFTVVDQADAVFLDLPAPWDAIPHAKQALRKDRVARICCFSPCMEQVLRTVSALNENGFSDITMYETLLRPHEVSYAAKPVSVSVARDKLRLSEIKKEDKRQKQIAGARTRALAKEQEHGAKRKRDEEESIPEKTEGDKRLRKDDGLDDNAMDAEDAVAVPLTGATDVPALPAAPAASTVLVQPTPAAAPSGAETVSDTTEKPKTAVSRVFAEVRGHTSYLTFACLTPLPRNVPASDEVAEPSTAAPAKVADGTSATSESISSQSARPDSVQPSAVEEGTSTITPPVQSEEGAETSFASSG
ncbi:tRNA methyltransferase complex GCD14 subunit [Punctularia strigosozonata HHB-11173 SS5]|uniref:tRNA methyltransferase complex GCD14 subunit n=1 Tax=Punctularia strigosozonata (strain HHB-11173) TaxID=741275 RepID=UPI000441838B|nr:tRNA methyltransferase complex GCD14 subunit [Punctularia strigosozonata HHB-11173 SS5]EIN12928.1 tRNA methyltransferase complex GCD14 subunit [Punctularia strigosozonata HHB-11173 SS5]